MSTNCLVTKLKGVVNNDNLPLFNVGKAFVDTTNASGNIGLSYIGSMIGAKIVTPGATFFDGTTEVTADPGNKILTVGPNQVFELRYPKYTGMFHTTRYDDTNSQRRNAVVFDIDDSDYFESEEQFDKFFNGYDTAGGKKMKGHLNKYLNRMTEIAFIGLPSTMDMVLDVTNAFNNATLNNINFNNQGSKVFGSINNAFTGATNFSYIYFNNTDIEGDWGTAFSNMIQANKTAFKEKTGTISLQVSNKTSFTAILGSDKKAIKFAFAGTSTVDILERDTDVKLGEYDIDTNTYTRS